MTAKLTQNAVAFPIAVVQFLNHCDCLSKRFRMRNKSHFTITMVMEGLMIFHYSPKEYA